MEVAEDDVDDSEEAAPRTLRLEGRGLTSAAIWAVLLDTLASIKSILASIDLTLCCTPTVNTFFLVDF